MAALSFTNELQSQLKEAGSKLSTAPSSIEELLDLLDTVEDLLSYVGQAPSSSMQEALLPSMGALISDELLRHSDADVNISVASCICEITRITAPDTPYNDEIMKEIFQLNVVAFGKLSHVSGRCYSKALHILKSTASVQSFFLMMDMEFDDLIAEMFHQFLSTIRSDHPHDVFLNMEKIMTKVIEESDEVSVELLSLLLSSVKKENLNASPIAWKLGEKIFNNCAGMLKGFLPGMMQTMSLDPKNYTEVVASICLDAPHTVFLEAEGLLTDVRSPGEIDHSVDGLSKSAMDNGMEHESFGDTLSSFNQSKQQTSSSQRSLSALSPTETEEPDRGAKIPKKRERKPNSRLGGYLIREETELEVHHLMKKGDGLNFLLGNMHGAHSQEKASQSADGALKEKGTKDSEFEERNESRDKEVAAMTRVETTPAPSNIAVKKEGILSDAEGTVGPSAEKVKDKKRKRGKASSGQKLVSPSATTSMKKGGNHSSEALKKTSAPPKEKKFYNTRVWYPLIAAPLPTVKLWIFSRSSQYFILDSGKAHEINKYAEELVGRRIKVWWPLDQMFYDGAVAAFDPSERKHTVLYADGDEEILNLHDEHWELLNMSPDREQNADHPCPATSADKRLKKKAKQKPVSLAKHEPAKQKAVLSVKSESIDFDESKDEGTEIGRRDGEQKSTDQPEAEISRLIKKPKHDMEPNTCSLAEENRIPAQEEVGDSSEAEESGKKRRRLVKGGELVSHS